jgi:hypothetical protein
VLALDARLSTPRPVDRLTAVEGLRSVATMPAPARPPPRLPRRSSVGFRPEFTLLLLYFFGFFVFFCLLLALPALLEGARDLPVGSAPLTDAERERAAGLARDALRGRVPYAALAALAALGLGAFTRTLPGLRRR